MQVKCNTRVHGFTGLVNIEHRVIMEWHKVFSGLGCFGNEDWNHVDTLT